VKSFGSLLDRVHIAAPCSADWKEMRGDERVRFCGSCSLNVYNLSAMTRREAERLVVQSEGRLCVRFYRRADGTTLTQNCPVGLRALKRRASRVASAVAAATFSFFAGLGLSPQTKKPGALPTVAVVRADAPPAAAEREPALEGWEGEEYAAVAGGAVFESGVEMIIPLGLLGGLMGLCSVPLLKARAWWEGKRREELSIWRKP
jgi:hypothetical protein